MSLAAYCATSTLLTATVVLNAWYTKQQFYPTVLYLATSKLCVCILGNMALVVTLIFGQFVRKLFFGPLRDVEVEHLLERSRDAIMETCLAMTIFRQDFDMKLISLFTALLFMKVFHWLAQDRVDFIEQSPAIPVSTHVRILTLLAILLFVDAMFLWTAVAHTVEQGPSVLILFGFEYTVLASTVVSTYIKYALHAIDLRMEGRWESRGVYLFYLDLTTDLFQLLVYFFFFMIIFSYYGLPLHIIRDLYLTFRNFRKRIADYFRYRRVTANMNERFPDATPEELSRGDRTCIICREEMTAAKRLPCSHLFHLHCLRSWLERQQSCPTCRTPLEPPAPTPVPEARRVPAAPAAPAAAAPAAPPVAIPAIPAGAAHTVHVPHTAPPAEGHGAVAAAAAPGATAFAAAPLTSVPQGAVLGAGGTLGPMAMPNFLGGMPLGPLGLPIVQPFGPFPGGMWPPLPQVFNPILGTVPGGPLPFFPMGAFAPLSPFGVPLAGLHTQQPHTAPGLASPTALQEAAAERSVPLDAQDGAESGSQRGNVAPAVLGASYFAQLQAQIECLQHQLFTLTGTLPDAPRTPAASRPSSSGVSSLAPTSADPPASLDSVQRLPDGASAPSELRQRRPDHNAHQDDS